MPKRRRASIASRVPRSRRREGDICAQGSSVTEIRYLGRRSDGSHLVRVAWRFRGDPDDLMRCNNGTRLQLRLVARYLGGVMRERTIDLSRRPSREAHTAVIFSPPCKGLATRDACRKRLILHYVVSHKERAYSRFIVTSS